MFPLQYQYTCFGPIIWPKANAPNTDLYPYQLHRLQLPVDAPHISTIAFDTEQELLWIGDETVSAVENKRKYMDLEGFF